MAKSCSPLVFVLGIACSGRAPVVHEQALAGAAGATVETGSHRGEPLGVAGSSVMSSTGGASTGGRQTGGTRATGGYRAVPTGGTTTRLSDPTGGSHATGGTSTTAGTGRVAPTGGTKASTGGSLGTGGAPEVSTGGGTESGAAGTPAEAGTSGTAGVATAGTSSSAGAAGHETETAGAAGTSGPACDPMVCYQDIDGDGFGYYRDELTACGECPDGYAENRTDYAPGSADLYPGSGVALGDARTGACLTTGEVGSPGWLPACYCYSITSDSADWTCGGPTQVRTASDCRAIETNPDNEATVVPREDLLWLAGLRMPGVYIAYFTVPDCGQDGLWTSGDACGDEQFDKPQRCD